MHKDIIKHTSDDAGYNRGLSIGRKIGLTEGFTKSITLIRHLQRTYNNMDCEQEILEEAMELISKNIETNNNFGHFEIES